MTSEQPVTHINTSYSTLKKTFAISGLLLAISGCNSNMTNLPTANTNPVVNNPVTNQPKPTQPNQSHDDALISPKPREGNADDQASNPEGINQVVTANNQFAISMYQQLNDQADQRDKNVFFSPFSLSSTMAILYNAALGETKQQIEQVFHYPSLPMLNSGNASLREQFNTPNPNYQLATVNDLWIREDLTLKPSYLKSIQRYYGDHIKPLDFVRQSEVSRQTINQSIAQQTNQMIPELLPNNSIRPSTVSVLTNAVYFKGDWQSPFGSSTDRDFYKLDATKTKTKMMTQQHYFGYAADDSVQVVELPYKGETLSMLVVLPKSKTKVAIDKVIRTLSAEKIGHWSQSLEKQTVNITLPKFTLSQNYKMKPLLSTMGMPRAFEKSAEFDIFDEKSKVNSFTDEVYHQAVIKVDERGSEAAAATAVVGIYTGGPVTLPVEFMADHPFIFVIKDNKAGAILFLGQVNEP